MTESALTRKQAEAIAETSVLAAHLAEQCKARIDYYVTQEKMKLADAVDRANNPPPRAVERALTCPAQEVNWWDLNALHAQDAALAVERWQSVRQAARDELTSGHYTANQARGTPFETARFLAIRDAFTRQWEPRNDGEQLLVDMLAQLYGAYIFWLGALQTWSELESITEKPERPDTGKKWKPKRLTDQAQIENAGAMVDRFNRLFLRTLRAFRDLRRYNASVTIQNAGQVNIASGPQMNAAKLESETESGE